MISNPSTFENWLTDRSNIGLEISLCPVVCRLLVSFGQVAGGTHVTSERNVRLGTDSFFVVRNRNAYKCRIRSYYVFRMLKCSNYKHGFTLIPGYIVIHAFLNIFNYFVFILFRKYTYLLHFYKYKEHLNFIYFVLIKDNDIYIDFQYHNYFKTL